MQEGWRDDREEQDAELLHKWDSYIYDEIKKLRRHKATQVNSMDGAQREGIPDHFKDVDKELYNRHEM